MKEELKPCPFCGGKAELYARSFNDVNVICGNCSCVMGTYGTKEKAIEAWNKRVPQTWTSKVFERIGEGNKTMDEVAE